MRNRGYTLIELLVVMGIIAILAAMIAPVLLQAKESARMQNCAQDLRQLGQAVTRYMDDHDGFGLPPSPPQYRNPWVFCPEPLCPGYLGQSMKPVVNPDPNGKPYTVAAGKQPKFLWVCPGDLELGSNPDEKPCWWNFGSSYLYPGPTAYLRSDDPKSKSDTMAKANTYPCKPGLWKCPKRDILLADFFADFHGGTRAERFSSADARSLNPPMYIKVNTINVVFLDGHLQAVTPEQRKQFQYYTTTIDNPYELPEK